MKFMIDRSKEEEPFLKELVSTFEDIHAITHFYRNCFQVSSDRIVVFTNNDYIILDTDLN